MHLLGDWVTQGVGDGRKTKESTSVSLAGGVAYRHKCCNNNQQFNPKVTIGLIEGSYSPIVLNPQNILLFNTHSASLQRACWGEDY